MAATKARLNMRVSDQNLGLIREAAEATGQDMTSFVISASLDRAREVLMQARLVQLSAGEAQRLNEALDAEPVPIPALASLLRTTLERDYARPKVADAVPTR